MAPPNSQKRVKGIQIYRPFVYGTIAKPFDPVTNPKPSNAPVDHTHSWTVFVKGVDDVDITYWLKKVQFKLHESIPNPLRTIEAVPGQIFRVDETGWGEFEISIKLHYVPESLEKPQSLWHGLRLHPYGTEEEKAAQKDEVRAFAYEEQVFNEPYEQFYEILINGNAPNEKVKGKSGGAGAGKKKGGANGAGAGGGAGGGNWGDRTASVPARSSPKQPYSRDTEMAEIKRLKLAQIKVEEQTKELKKELAAREAKLAALKA